MCFADLEKAFDSVPRGVLWGVLQEYGVSGPLIQTVHSLISRGSRGVEGVRFGDLGIGSLVFADDVVLFVSSARDLQLSLDRFAAACEAAGVRISTSKSEAMVLSQKKVECLLQVREEILPQLEEFKYLGVLFRSEGRMKQEIDRDRVRSSAIWEELGVEPLVLRVERNQMRWLGHLVRMPPGRLPGEVFRAYLSGRRPPGRPRTRWRDFVSRLVWKCLGISPDELEKVAGESKVWASLLRLLPL
ncbi:hypothetical protein D4764_01G0015210 [Takifugu flavidus]|uniref:Reverse transcriptase domain-containing protein n=1 Tax=Takifugu flavidus TaxID=433684 RepID=A0A5C6PS04_9TELE|nr:hypothetical protein D4764_01G0015210 [Takifugu flavidus]